MAFVPPDNLRRLIRQYYRQIGKPIPADTKFSPQSFLFVKYKCEFGYEFVDEIDTMFCQDKQWVLTAPICRGKGLLHLWKFFLVNIYFQDHANKIMADVVTLVCHLITEQSNVDAQKD